MVEALQGITGLQSGEDVKDSQYVVNAITTWRAGWEQRNWRNAQGKPVMHRELWESLFAEVNSRRVFPKWVKGHNGDPDNEQADALANEAIPGSLGAPTP